MLAVFAVFWRCRRLVIALFVCCCQINHHVDDRIVIMYPIVQVLRLDLDLCFRQFRTSQLLRGVGNIGRDDKSLHVVMEPDAVCGGLGNGGQELLEVCRSTLAPIKGRRHDVNHHILNGCCGWPLSSSLDGAEKLVQVVSVNCPKIRSVRCAEDQISDLGSNDGCNFSRYGLF